MTITTRSGIAEQFRVQRVGRARGVPVWGLMVHTTGDGIVVAANNSGAKPLDRCIDWYTAPGNPFAHYVLGYTGQLVQIADEATNAWHAAIAPEERADYLSGTWKTKVSPAGLALWEQRWPGVKSPSHLYPSSSPNADYIGIELVPLLKAADNGTRHTNEQYAKLALLMSDIEQRHAIKLAGNRLVAHEDVSPYKRWDSRGGWDPGALRVNKMFRWELIR